MTDILWQERIDGACTAYRDWQGTGIPVELLADKMLKAAGVRDLVKENTDLREDRDHWEERYEKLLTEVGGVWPG